MRNATDRDYAGPLLPKNYRSMVSATSEDLVFKCSECGEHRIYGKRLAYGKEPENTTPLINCHNRKRHGGWPKLTMQVYVPTYMGSRPYEYRTN